MNNSICRRGILNFMNLVDSDNTASNKSTPSKGRSKILIQNRNNLLLTRYWFYAFFTQNRFDIIIKILSFEFKIAERRVADVIQEDSKIVEALKKKRPTLKQLNMMYPFMVWKKGLNYNVDDALILEGKLFKNEIKI
jgi:hypothetical protein